MFGTPSIVDAYLGAPLISVKTTKISVISSSLSEANEILSQHSSVCSDRRILYSFPFSQIVVKLKIILFVKPTTV